MTRLRRLVSTHLDPRKGLLLLLGVLLLLIQATAILGIVDSRRRAERAAVLELEESVSAQAATLEAALATLYGDLRYFVHSWTVADAPRLLAAEDPVTRRWSRLDLDGAALLFLESHPALDRIYVERSNGELLTAVGWRQGSPVILRRDEITAGPRDAGPLHESVWNLTARQQETVGRVRTWVNPERLLAETLPNAKGLSLTPVSAGTASEASGEYVVSAPVEGSAWQPPVGWRLERRTQPDALLGSMRPIVGGFRRTLAFNLVIIAASAVLGIAVIRQTRRAAIAEAELRHREQRQELERQVQHNERLAAVGRLAAGVAHEINNPLSGVVNYLSLLRQELDSGDLDAARSLVDSIREGTDSATEVVRQVLTFAEPGRTEHRRIDLTSVGERTFGFVASNPAYRHLELTHSAPERPLTVHGEAAALSQLILNLLLNACDLQRDGGRVEFEISRRANHARITISDRGPGISGEASEHLFEPFYSTRGSTGLGLAVCHGIVTAHGGSIEASNRDRGGARFVVELPLATEAVEGDSATSQASTEWAETA